MWCFSPQYYLVISIYISAILILVIGLNCITFNNYNPLSDPAIPIIIFLWVGFGIVLKNFSISFGKWLKIWRIDVKNS